MKMLGDNIFDACEKGSLDDVVQLIDQGVSVNEKNSKGWTPLIVASFHGHYDLAKQLISRGADVNATNNKGTTVFMYAKTRLVGKNDYSFLSFLLDCGAEINRKDNFGLTVLDYVLPKDNNMASYLKSKGALQSAQK